MDRPYSTLNEYKTIDKQGNITAKKLDDTLNCPQEQKTHVISVSLKCLYKNFHT